MSTTDRIESAAGRSSTVVSAEGLLAAFNDAGVLDPLDVLSAMTIARVCGESDEHVVLAAALAVRGTRFGHVCVRISTLQDTVVVDGQDPTIIETLAWPQPADWEQAIARSAMVGDGNGDEPLVLSGGLLFLQRYFRYEELVARLIGDRCGPIQSALDTGTEEILSRLLPPGADGQTTLQHAAVALALKAEVTVIAGGPGTGKTFAVGALLATLASRRGEEFPLVALCAPTGKAAARLGEAVAEFASTVDDPAVHETLAGVEASTMHRLLGWGRGRGQFAHNARNPLPHDLVIVDEMSMVSLPMAAKLLAAVRPDAKIVLVGDPFQLESIEAGTVLADIVGPAADASAAPTPAGPSIRDHVVVLDRVHRFETGSVIADFADAVREGKPDLAIELLGQDSVELQWIPEHAGSGFRDLWDTVLERRSRMVELAMTPGNDQEVFEALSGMAVLCARRNGPGSVAWWRWNLETALDERFTGLRYGGEWYPGRPVMITRNDYNLGLYNGDIGVAVQTDEGLRVVFERGGLRAFLPSHLIEHTTVHAMTIHKSQGSQFDEVAVVLPGERSRLLTRELLYTAVTRAKRKVWLVGNEDVVRHAIERSVQRASGLRTRLWRE